VPADDETVLLLERTARGRSDDLAALACQELVELRGAEAIPGLLEVLAAAPAPRRAAVLAALEPHADDERVHAAAVELAAGAPAERVAAAGVLAARGSADAPSLLADQLDDPAALRVLARHPQVDVDAARLASSDDPEVRALAGAALAARGDLDALRTLLADPDDAVRRAVADALAQHPREELAGPLAALLSDPARPVRHAAAGALRTAGAADRVVDELVLAGRRLPRGPFEGPAGRLLAQAVDEHRRVLLDDALQLAGADEHALSPQDRDRLAPLLAPAEDESEPVDHPSALIAELAASAEGGSMSSTIERLIQLRAAPALAEIPLQELHALAADAETVSYTAGARIFETGDEADRFFVVTAGRVGIEREQVVGVARVGELGPGQSFGEAALFAEGKRTATARARTDATLLAVDGRAFRQLGLREPKLLLEALRVASRRLDEANARLERG
jgi:hypothetical protein